jgi:hypothetical protein
VERAGAVAGPMLEVRKARGCTLQRLLLHHLQAQRDCTRVTAKQRIRCVSVHDGVRELVWAAGDREARALQGSLGWCCTPSDS